ncbi:MAG TPA: HAD-IIA family hydrolase [Gemmatimonadaceae bacterium]|nr:HAD-IIA family hydrolase [Gemmatimonadaceae bacterium]
MTADALLLDIDGTLYVGDTPIPGAVDTVRALAEREIPRRYLTNTTRFTRRMLAGRLRDMGFAIADTEIFTPRLAAARWLAAHHAHHAALYLPDGACEDLAPFAADSEPAGSPTLATSGSAVTPLAAASTPAASGPGAEPSPPDAVVVGDLGAAWDFATLNRAFRQLMDGARLVALQKNRYWLTPEGLALDAGPFVAALEYATGRDAVVVGKPSAAFFELAAASLGIDPARIAVVGDDVETDVAGAQAAGMTGVLVRTGKFREDTLRNSPIQPDAVLPSIAHVLELL